VIEGAVLGEIAEVEVVALADDLAFHRGQKAHEAADKGGFAGAVGAEDAKGAAGNAAEIVEANHGAFGVAKRPMGDFDQGSLCNLLI
jgi:hypothetical protein